jgi:hypothetical protein
MMVWGLHMPSQSISSKGVIVMLLVAHVLSFGLLFTYQKNKKKIGLKSYLQIGFICSAYLLSIAHMFSNGKP